MAESSMSEKRSLLLMSLLALERKVAIDAVAKASQLSLGILKSFPKNHFITKSDASPVTLADYSVQALVHCFVF